jgi:hypothetical protein
MGATYTLPHLLFLAYPNGRRVSLNGVKNPHMGTLGYGNVQLGTLHSRTKTGTQAM